MSEIRSNRSIKLAGNARLHGVWLVLAALSLGLILRLMWLQIIDAPNLQTKARALQSITVRPFVPRRTIVDRQNRRVAIDLPSYTIYAHPILFSETKTGKGFPKNGLKVKIEREDMAARLAPILNVDAGVLAQKFRSRKTGVSIGSGLREDIGNRIKELRLEGLEVQQEKIDYTRVYPQDRLLAEVLGYIQLDRASGKRQAQAGVELSQSPLLEREVKEYQLTKTAKGGILPDRVPPEMLHTDDIQLKLTVDVRLQAAARTALNEKMQEWNAPRGAVIVMAADTGALRALVVEPTYDPNNYTRDFQLYRQKFGKEQAMRLLGNWAVSDLYEPGSTFKPLSIAIALENQAITPNSTFVDNGKIVVGEHLIQNFNKKGNGTIDIAQVLQHSSNIGMVKIVQRLKPDLYYNWLQRIGLGQKSGIDLPAEPRGSLRSRHEFINYPIYAANASFGQGFSLTPIQLVTLMGSLANGGKLVTPHVVDGLFDSEGNRKDKPNHPEPTQIFSPKTAQTALELMETVVTKGSGMRAQISGYRIAGKTGTAQQNYTDDDNKIVSFVGILPVDAQRRYIVFAAVDRPKGKEKAYGGNVAAPIVKSVMESLISLERIPPSNPSEVGKPLPKPEPEDKSANVSGATPQRKGRAIEPPKD